MTMNPVGNFISSHVNGFVANWLLTTALERKKKIKTKKDHALIHRVAFPITTHSHVIWRKKPAWEVVAGIYELRSVVVGVLMRLHLQPLSQELHRPAKWRTKRRSHFSTGSNLWQGFRGSDHGWELRRVTSWHVQLCMFVRWTMDVGDATSTTSIHGRGISRA